MYPIDMVFPNSSACGCGIKRSRKRQILVVCSCENSHVSSRHLKKSSLIKWPGSELTTYSVV